MRRKADTNSVGVEFSTYAVVNATLTTERPIPSLPYPAAVEVQNI